MSSLQLRRVTWWTRHDENEPELSDCDDDDDPEQDRFAVDSNAPRCQVTVEPVILEQENQSSCKCQK